MYMLLKDGKSKVLTLSYDDGVMQDIRLIEILNKYGIKATFNIDTGLYFPEDVEHSGKYDRMKLSEAQKLYTNSGHELAVHTLTHPFLNRLTPQEIAHEVLEDRKNIEKQYGMLARGLAYPYGSYNEEVMNTLAMCGICYARTAASTERCFFPDNWLALNPTCHHNHPRLMELAQQFAEGPIGPNDIRLFYLWGHSYEFDECDNWEVIEKFAEYMSGREDIWYATNIELYNYVQTYNALQVGADNSIVHNPSATDVWFRHQGKNYCVKGGETLVL